MPQQTLFTLIDVLSLEELEEVRQYVEARHRQLTISYEVEAFREGRLHEGLAADELENAVDAMKPLYPIRDE